MHYAYEYNIYLINDDAQNNAYLSLHEVKYKEQWTVHPAYIMMLMYSGDLNIKGNFTIPTQLCKYITNFLCKP